MDILHSLRRGAFWHTEKALMFRWNFHSRARHPLARLLAAVVGAVALLVLLAFGVFAAAALIVGGAVVLLVKALRAPQATPTAERPAPDGVIEGEFRVVHDASVRRQPVR
jgi:fatty acid desaturase